MDANRLKVILTAGIILAGAILTLAVGAPSSSTPSYSTGIVIDFEPYDCVWTPVDTEQHSGPIDALKYACEKNSFSYEITGDEVKSIKGVEADEEYKWGLWGIEKESSEWTSIPAPFDSVRIDSYTICSWSLRKSGEFPTVAVDQTGVSIYGFKQSQRTVSLTPSITEMVASVGATKSLVGTDSYSNYPDEVVQMQISGDIVFVGDYTTPSYENILKVKPDMVLCDGSQYNHLMAANSLRENGKAVMVLYPGESLSTILDNIYITGTVLGYDQKSKVLISDINDAIAQMKLLLDTSYLSKKVNTMITLSADKSPFISGSYTYASDAMSKVYGNNVFSEYDGWAHINSELILMKNPSAIIIMTSDYKATQSDYDSVVASMSKEWKSTDAYKNGEIYVLCEGAGDLTQRPGPRAAQLTELIGRILNPDVFDDISIPKFIGDNYKDYLSYTKYIE